MLFRQLYDQESSTYTYLIADAPGGTAVLIDPVLEQMPQYKRVLSELQLDLRYAIDTHVHADHITALGALRDETGCKTVMGQQSQADCVDQRVGDGDVLEFGGLKLEVIYTPGHTDDSYSFRLGDKLFTGDTLFIRGTGRTDFQNGDSAAAYDSLFNKLLIHPDETLVYPGHDYKGWTVSTIGEEKQHNPRLQVADAAAYAELMGNLNLAKPKKIDIAVPANLKCGKLDD